jgi:hypothetical protein
MMFQVDFSDNPHQNYPPGFQDVQLVQSPSCNLGYLSRLTLDCMWSHYGDDNSYSA